MKRALVVTLLLFGLVYVIACFRYAPPASAPRDAPRDRFSAERAGDIQQRLAGDGETRYVYSAANTRAQATIKDELRKSGWEIDVQSAMSCTYHGMCAPITNVIGKLVGEQPSLPAVLLTAHYDSVPVSPGASDNGVGTSTLLETARALSEGPKRPLRTVIVLLGDGEEAGLLGADAFVRQNPLARTVGTTINVDARGSHGPSQMFETSAWGNGWLIDLVSKHVDRPVTTSLYYEVYKRMPNDTDFTATKSIASGVNFANTAGIEHYHTPLDSLATADRGTLQHHGDHVLGMARALANDTVTHAHTNDGSEKDVVWFDVLAFGVVKWPESYSVMIALIALMLVVGQGIRARTFDRGLSVFFMSFLPGLIAALAAGLLLKVIGATPAPWVAHPMPGLVVIHAAAMLAAIGIANEIASKSSPRALWVGTWMGWGLVGVLTAVLVPGASYLFVVPTIAAAIVGPLTGSRISIACVVPAAVAAVLVLALATATYEAVGFTAAPLIALPTALLSTTLAPMLPGVIPPRFSKRSLLGVLAVCILSAIVALIVPKFSSANQQRVNVVFRQDEGSASSATTARVFVDTTWGPAIWGAPPAAMMNAIGARTSTDKAPSLPWWQPSSYATVAAIDLKAPVVEIIHVTDNNNTRRVQARLRSAREASTIAIVFPPSTPSRHVTMKVGGRVAFPRPIATGGSVVGLLGVPNTGIEVDFESSVGVATEPIPIIVIDRTYGVPPGTKAEDAVRARTNEATPFQDGDVTVVSKALSI